MPVTSGGQAGTDPLRTSRRRSRRRNAEILLACIVVGTDPYLGSSALVLDRIPWIVSGVVADGISMKSSLPLLLALATILISCTTTRPTHLVLLNATTGARFVGTVVPGDDALMTASIEINGVSFRGKFDPSVSSTATILVGAGSDLLHCTLHFNAKTRIGSGECVQTGRQRFDLILSEG